MLRKLLIAFGVFEILAPRPVIAACERIGLENPDAARLRPRAIELARLEGLAVVWLLLRGRERSSLVGAGLGLAGIAAVLSPRPLIRLTQVVAYENTTDLELKPWVEPAARLLGVCYLTVVAFSGRADAPTDERAEERADDSDTGFGDGTVDERVADGERGRTVGGSGRGLSDMVRRIR